MEQGLAYLYSAELKGKRHKGPKEIILKENIFKKPLVFTFGDTYDSPLLIINEENNRAFITSAVSNPLNQKLIKERIEVDGIVIKLKDNNE